MSNMLIAKDITPNSSNINVRLTHRYIKFMPSNWDEYDILRNDTNLILSDRPLDYEILEYSNSYHDPAVPEELPTYQYASVKAEQEIPNVTHTILAEMYIPEEDPELVEKIDLVDELLDYAYTITGNYADTLKKRVRGQTTPQGKITVYDNRLLSYIGLEGVKVCANRWFTNSIGKADANGDYICDKNFSRPFDYKLIFESSKFDVRSGTFGQAIFQGPNNTKNPWVETLDDNTTEQFQATVFRGAFMYHHKPIGGLLTPSNNFRMKYGAMEDWDNGGVWRGHVITLAGIYPDIKIARYVNKNTKTRFNSDEIFSVAIHETAHRQHVKAMNAGYVQFWQVTGQLQESWACAVEWFLTSKEYNARGITNYGESNFNPPYLSTTDHFPAHFGYQYWNNTINANADKYTSLFINLIDNFNENGVTTFWGKPNGSVNDNVTGYNLATIESNFLKHCYGLSSLSTQLKANKPSGVTDQQIDNLISGY
jgi:hypothetical protein